MFDNEQVENDGIAVDDGSTDRLSRRRSRGQVMGWRCALSWSGGSGLWLMPALAMAMTTISKMNQIVFDFPVICG